MTFQRGDKMQKKDCLEMEGSLDEEGKKALALRFNIDPFRSGHLCFLRPRFLLTKCG